MGKRQQRAGARFVRQHRLALIVERPLFSCRVKPPHGIQDRS
jgi:hypothetical protein